MVVATRQTLRLCNLASPDELTLSLRHPAVKLLGPIRRHPSRSIFPFALDFRARFPSRSIRARAPLSGRAFSEWEACTRRSLAGAFGCEGRGDARNPKTPYFFPPYFFPPTFSPTFSLAMLSGQLVAIPPILTNPRTPKTPYFSRPYFSRPTFLGAVGLFKTRAFGRSRNGTVEDGAIPTACASGYGRAIVENGAALHVPHPHPHARHPPRQHLPYSCPTKPLNLPRTRHTLRRFPDIDVPGFKRLPPWRPSRGNRGKFGRCRS
jgi:hypothetical protein